MAKMNLTDIYRIIHPKTADYTFFSAVPRIFSKIDHILGQEANLTNAKKSK
jgi:exonuclease III